MAKTRAGSAAATRSGGTNGVRSVPGVLANHLRFSVVLSLLEARASASPEAGEEKKGRERESGSAKISKLLKVGAELGIAGLFDGKAGDSDSEELSVAGWLSSGAWVANFKGKPRVFKTVYECQAFYGLDAPNNVVLRFERMLKEIEDRKIEDSKKNKVRTLRKADYEERIRGWGKYASGLVKVNGDWDGFIQKLQEQTPLNDFWPGTTSAEIGKWAGNRPIGLPEPSNSFIQRILSLVNNRYIQILVSPVAVLWPLWALTDPQNWDRMKHLNKAVGPKLPNKTHLCIDVNVRVGSMAGLPFPFGFANQAIRKAAESDRAVDDKAPWSPKAVNLVARELQALPKADWVPPLLFAGRGGQWKHSEHIAEFMAVCEPIDFFASVFVKKPQKKGAAARVLSRDDKKIIAAFEADSLAETELLRMEPTAANVDRSVYSWRKAPLARTEMCGAFPDAKFDVVMSCYPNDLLISENAKYVRHKLNEVFRDFNDSLVLGRTALAGAASLQSQPGMSRLVIDLGLIIKKLATMCEHLCPIREEIAGPLRAIREEPESRFERLPGIRGHIRGNKEIKELTRQFGDLHRDANAQLQTTEIEQIMGQILKSMGDAMFGNDRPLRKQFADVAESWGWALLLDYIWHTPVFFSHALFAAVENT